MMSCRAVAGAALLAVTLYTLGDLVVFTQPSRGSGPCLLDDEGSWSIGLFKGSSPLNLTPIEYAQPQLQGPAAWPVANPILTCASVEGAPSNFVADPFLWVQPGGAWYIFFETKTNTNMQGDIGVVESRDGGATWRYLGLALDEPWHLSYPFVFQWEGQVYMVPEGYGSGALRLYRAVDFPLGWEFQAVLVDRPLIDTSLVEWQGRWWMLTSDVRRRGATKNGELEAYYADTPLGPWTPHALNPLMNGDRRVGARMGGRVVPYQGALLRFGQDCGDTYGHRLVAYRIDKLTPTEFRQSAVPLEFGQSQQGRGAWNGVRYHHIDAHQLPDGSWVGVMDGDSQPSGPISSRLRRAAALLGTLWGTTLGLACIGWLHVRHSGRGVGVPGEFPQLPTATRLPLRCGSACGRQMGWQWDKTCPRALARLWQSLGSMAARLVFPDRNSSKWLHSAPRHGSPSRRLECIFCAAGSATWGGWRAACRRAGVDPGSRAGAAALVLAAAAAAAGVVAGLVGWYYLSIWWERPTAAAAAAVEGQLSKFTLLAMTYSARMPSLRLFVQHYSKCPSVAEIVLVWNSGPPPDVARDFPGAALPMRVRMEAANSLNNRFRPDPRIKTRAVLELDDDILMWCSDLERGFAAWRQHPNRLVGYYPRQLYTQPPAYIGERAVFRERAYNAILTGAAFMDAEKAFQLYWSDEFAAGRAVVDRLFNCEDILMNFVLASAARRNQSAAASSGQLPLGRVPAVERSTVLYVRPRRRLDISQLSRVGISRNSGAHAEKRRACLAEFGRMLGANPLRTARIRWTASARPPACFVPGLGCVYL